MYSKVKLRVVSHKVPCMSIINAGTILTFTLVENKMLRNKASVFMVFNPSVKKSVRAIALNTRGW